MRVNRLFYVKISGNVNRNIYLSNEKKKKGSDRHFEVKMILNEKSGSTLGENAVSFSEKIKQRKLSIFVNNPAMMILYNRLL